MIAFARRYPFLLLGAVVGVLAFVSFKDGQVGLCQRLQTVRDQTNTLTLLAHDAWSDGADRERRLGEKTHDPEHVKSAATLSAVAESMVVTPPTDCRMAVYLPEFYTAPRPVFIDRKGTHVEAARAHAQSIVEEAR